MVFSSSLFLLYFFPIFLLVYYLADTRYKNGVILAFSVFFYAWGAPKFLFVILASIIVDFYLSHAIYDSEKPRRKKAILIFSVCLNVSILLYFKYANFFVENINALLGYTGASPLHWTNIALPIGISFFTFHELSYIIDVYRGVNKPMKRITDYAVYILLFPQLIAGPIIRYKEITNQIIDRHHQETIDNRLTGFFRFVIGLSKKVLIANVLSVEVDRLFALPPEMLSASLAWTAAIAYSFQIYFDFSGYSDMAIGIARMLGILFPENFDNPYISKSITEFWRRWHISLGRWMRDYLYIPLGGNQVKSKARLYFNLWLVFLISGFWHGAAWNFIVWGAFHGMFLIADRLFLLRITERIGKIPSMMLTYLIVIIGWVFFRSNTIEHSFGFLKAMAGLNKHLFADPITDIKFYIILFIAAIFAFSGAFEKIHHIQQVVLFRSPAPARTLAFGLTSLALIFLCLGSISSTGFNPFIYFRF
jgi:alginate O-acetyltransferase complex protein AlgI